MKWLQWSTANLTGGLGGVEVHARSLARELTQLGVDVVLSSDVKDLASAEWDVVQTHGSAFARGHQNAVSVHTLHGSTMERMVACREWAWPGGYRAWGQEIFGTLYSDVTLAVHADLWLFKLSKRISKISEVCWNGWDSKESSPEQLPSELLQKLRDINRPFWLFVGRGDDFVKGADRVCSILDGFESMRLVAAPGSGFESRSDVVATGRLTPSQVSALMSRAQGLLVASYYEGLPLVILEALAEGTPVVATAVGGIPMLPEGLRGLFTVPSLRSRLGLSDKMKSSIRLAEAEDLSDFGRKKRGDANKVLLPSWRSVAKIALDAAENAIRKKRQP